MKINKQDLCSEYLMIKGEIKDYEKRLKEIQEIFRDDLKDDFIKHAKAEIFYGPFKVSLTQQIRMNADSEALRKDNIFEKYCKPTACDIFKVSLAK